MAPRSAIGEANGQPAGILGYPRIFGARVANEEHAGRAGLLEVDLPETVRANILGQHDHPCIGPLSLDLECVLDGLGAADAAAVRVIIISGLDTLDHDDSGSLAQFGVQSVAGKLLLQFALRYHTVIRPVQVHLRFAFDPADGDDGHTVLDGLFGAAAYDAADELTDVPVGPFDCRVQVDVDSRVCLDAGDEVRKACLHVRPFQRGAQLAEIASELGFGLDQVHVEPLVADRQSGRHTRQSASDHQRRGNHGGLPRLERPQVPCPRHGHAHECDGLFGGRGAVLAVNPGALVADIGHGEEVLVEPRDPQRFLEQRLVRSRRARGHHQAVEAMFADEVLDSLLVGVAAGVEAGFGVDDVGHLAGAACDFFDVHDGCDVVSAVADEHPDAGLFVGDVALPGIFELRDQRTADVSELRHGPRCGPGALGDGFGNVLGLLACAGYVHARAAGRHRAETVGLTETELVEFQAQAAGHLTYRCAGAQAHRQDHHVELAELLGTVGVEEAYSQLLAVGHFDDPRRDRANELDVMLVAGPVDVAVEFLSERAYVHAEDRDIGLRYVFDGAHRFLCGRHAADRRTVSASPRRVSRPDTLDERNALDVPAVRGAEDLAGGRTGRTEHPLELNAGQDVCVPPMSELSPPGGLERVKARRQDHRTDVERPFRWLHVVVNGPRFARDDALPALAAQTACQAAPGLGDSVFETVSQVDLAEVACALAGGRPGHPALLDGRGVGVGIRRGIRLFDIRIALPGHLASRRHSADVGVDGLGGRVPLRYRVNQRRRTQYSITAREDARCIRRQRPGVRGDPAARAAGQAAKIAVVDPLPDRHDHRVRRQVRGPRIIELG